MAVRPIPDPDHVARHVPARLVQRDNGVAIACFPQAFELRAATGARPAETYLSATWLEFYRLPPAKRLSEARREVGGYRELKRRDAFAVANVGSIRKLGSVRDAKLRVMHEPKDHAPAYAAIRGISRDDSELLNLLAAEAVSEIMDIASIDREALA
jgi:hypothetical protein